ncbi:S1C family serine protease [Patescibacteria group bacterium]|nr:S1C family serine protease [Patescibacteria group bacterium]
MSKKSDKQLIRIAVVSTAFGLLAALVGTFVFIGIFMPGKLFMRGVDIESQNQEFLKTSLGIKAYARLEVFEFLDKALPSVAGIYKKKSSPQLIDRLYLDKDRFGYGFVLTSDGWIVTTKSVIDGWGTGSLAVSIKDKMYDVKSKVYDSWTDIVFLKIDADNLPVTKLGDSSGLALGDIVFTGSRKNNFWFSFVNTTNTYSENKNKSDLILSSEEFGKVLKLQDEIPEYLDGGLVSNRKGEVVGVVVANQNENYVLPINYFKGIVSGVLKNKIVDRPYLGVNYIDLSFALGNDLPDNTGAYVYGGGLLSSVVSGSPAYKAGVRIGDMILSVDDESVGEYKNLAEIISEYQAGDEITLKILRAGKEDEVRVKLGAK